MFIYLILSNDWMDLFESFWSVQIVEEGSYAELLASKKVFAQHLRRDLQDMKELGLSPLGTSGTRIPWL